MSLESLPSELIVDILTALDIQSIVACSQLSRRFRNICADPQINPWRVPILRNLRSDGDRYEPGFGQLSLRYVFPRHNWIDILSRASAQFLLFQATLPHLKNAEWEEVFSRRFLPSWKKWKRDSSWREAFLKVLYRVWHRSTTSCTTDEAWTRYIVLNRNGTANCLDASSRTFNPLAMFQEMRVQSNLANYPTTILTLLELRDVRILAFGVLHSPTGNFIRNHNAHVLLRPPDVSAGQDDMLSRDDMKPLVYPQPSFNFSRYPYCTPGPDDLRWEGAISEAGKGWVGGMLLVAQLLGPNTKVDPHEPPAWTGADLVFGPGRGQFASLAWEDLMTIAPWLRKSVTKALDGPGLGV